MIDRSPWTSTLIGFGAILGLASVLCFKVWVVRWLYIAIAMPILGAPWISYGQAWLLMLVYFGLRSGYLERSKGKPEEEIVKQILSTAWQSALWLVVGALCVWVFL